MSDPTDDQIRDALQRAMSDSPVPHPWADVEARVAGGEASPSTSGRRTGVWLVAAACTIALVAGLIVLIDSDDERLRVAEGPTPATSTLTSPATRTTDVPSTTFAATPADEPGWTGGSLDNFDGGSLRALDTFAEGDVIVPTGPSGWRVSSSGAASPGDGSMVRSHVTVIEAQPVTIPIEPIPEDGRPMDPAGQRIILTLTRSPECVVTSGCSPSGPPLTINGVEWQSFSAGDEPDTVPYSAVRGAVDDLWIWVTAPAITLYESSDGETVELGGFGDPLLDEPTIVAFLEGLRVGSPEDLAGVGTACWNCDAEVVGNRDDGSEAVQLGSLESRGLRPLSAVSSGDVLVPTAPSDWYLPTTLYGDAETTGLPVSTFSVWTDASRRRSLELYLAPACDAAATRCPMAGSGYDIGWPVADEIVLDDIAWGYPGGRPGESAAAVIGDYVVAIAGTWYESPTPLLNDPDVLTLLEGLRVASLADLPEQIRVVDESGQSLE